MTVQELIEALQAFDPEKAVWKYTEFGYEPISEVSDFDGVATGKCVLID